MDFLSPVVDTVTGIEMAQWRDIIVFCLKVFIFTVPFVVAGLILEKDTRRTLVLGRVVKSFIVLLFSLPVFLFGLLNYLAPGLPETFWDKYPLLEGLWIMEGAWPPVVLSALALLYFLLYIIENIGGDLKT